MTSEEQDDLNYQDKLTEVGEAVCLAMSDEDMMPAMHLYLLVIVLSQVMSTLLTGSDKFEDASCVARSAAYAEAMLEADIARLSLDPKALAHWRGYWREHQHRLKPYEPRAKPN